MCEHVARANRLIEAYQSALFDAAPVEHHAALTAIHALRQVTGANRGELQACALPHEDQTEVCLS